jgi:hypothetical protein
MRLVTRVALVLVAFFTLTLVMNVAPAPAAYAADPYLSGDCNPSKYPDEKIPDDCPHAAEINAMPDDERSKLGQCDPEGTSTERIPNWCPNFAENDAKENAEDVKDKFLVGECNPLNSPTNTVPNDCPYAAEINALPEDQRYKIGECDPNDSPTETVPDWCPNASIHNTPGSGADPGTGTGTPTTPDDFFGDNGGTGTGNGSTGAGTGNVNFNTANIEKLSGWLAWLALLSCIIGIFISASLWALGSKGQNPGQELTGKKGMILCCTAAFFVGALPNLLGWLEGAAHQADTTGVTGNGGSVINNNGGNGGSPSGVPANNDANGHSPNAPGGAGTPGASNNSGSGAVTQSADAAERAAQNARAQANQSNNPSADQAALRKQSQANALFSTNPDGTINGCPGVKNPHVGSGNIVNVPGCGRVNSGTVKAPSGVS